jgi:serine/threonine protein kinase
VESSDIPEGGIQALLPDRPEPPRADAAGAAASTGPTGGGGSAVAPADHGLSEHWMIDHAAIALGKTIGHSSFGMVNEGRLNGTKVAVKTIKRDGKGGKGDDVEAFKKEAELNCKLRHPNVVLFMGICVQPAEVCIVTELMARGNVHDLLVEPIKGKSVKLTWKLRLQWAIDTAQGMAYLHSLTPPMIHRDLKTTNLLVDRGMNVKICDFGLSRFQADDKIMSAVGTVQFAAPEVLRHEKYTEKADLFSYGTVLWELHTRRTIFHGMPQIAVYKSVVDGDMPPVGDGCDARYAQLVRDCWRLDASKRPSFRACLDRLSPLWEELPDDE